VKPQQRHETGEPGIVCGSLLDHRRQRPWAAGA
jgi:hypothetical protein